MAEDDTYPRNSTGIIDYNSIGTARTCGQSSHALQAII